jgi:hypothetical protein
MKNIKIAYGGKPMRGWDMFRVQYLYQDGFKFND